MGTPPVTVRALRPLCGWGHAALEECGKVASTEEEARRRCAYLTVAEEDEREEVVVLCPTAAKHEFENAG
jgi:hypothetical protein